LRIYKVNFNLNGKSKTIKLKASSKKEAIRLLKKRYKKSIIIKIEEINKKLFYEISFFDDFKLDDLIFIFDQLYVMLDAGISIDIALLNVLEGIKNRRLKEIFTDIYNKINAGYSLYEAFKRYESVLGVIVISMISLGERSGDIASAFKELSIILNEINDNRKRFKKATRYPLLIIFVMLIAFVIIILFVIPPFKSIFAQLHGELPLPTRFLLWIEGAVKDYGILILGGAISVFVLLNFLYKNFSSVKLFFDKFFLRMYILGRVIRLAMLGRFIFVFKSLIESGISITESFDVALSIVENSYLKKKLILIKEEIIRGRMISEGFKKTGLFESIIIQIIKNGEESGNLVNMLNKVSLYYLKEYRYLVDNIAVLVEPLLIAAIAGFIFTIALGVFLPMWNLTEMF